MLGGQKVGRNGAVACSGLQLYTANGKSLRSVRKFSDRIDKINRMVVHVIGPVDPV